jgi:hypothetical protein
MTSYKAKQSRPRARRIRQAETEGPFVLALFKFVILLGLVAFLGLAGFAYLGDLSPSRSERSVPVTLDVE